MDTNTLVAINIIARLFAASIALGGAAFLAYKDMPGWGWLIFAAILLGPITVSESGGQ